MCWLHRGAFGCALELGTGVHTVMYLKYVMYLVGLLRSCRVTPLLVFDGANLPAKAGTNEKRRTLRREKKTSGNAMVAAGNLDKARDMFQQSLDITPEMIANLIAVCRANAVGFLVAPYEADAQLAFLSAAGLVDAVISEDSDLLCYGCTNILYKMNKDGYGQQLILNDILSQDNIENVTDPSLRLLKHLNYRQFIQVCVLSGCDYLPSIPGMGLKTAVKLMRKYRSIERLLQHLCFHKKWRSVVPQGYKESFKRAEAVFLHQRVFDPLTRSLVLRSPFPASDAIDSFCDAFIGPPIAADAVESLADGTLDPVSLRPRCTPSLSEKEFQDIKLIMTRQVNQVQRTTSSSYSSSQNISAKAPTVVQRHDSSDQVDSDLTSILALCQMPSTDSQIEESQIESQVESQNQQGDSDQVVSSLSSTDSQSEMMDVEQSFIDLDLPFAPPCKKQKLDRFSVLLESTSSSLRNDSSEIHSDYQFSTTLQCSKTVLAVELDTPLLSGSTVSASSNPFRISSAGRVKSTFSCTSTAEELLVDSKLSKTTRTSLYDVDEMEQEVMPAVPDQASTSAASSFVSPAVTTRTKSILHSILTPAPKSTKKKRKGSSTVEKTSAVPITKFFTRLTSMN
eukprot:GILK01014806.1.p1 GENE.GILK01014806.1~~GILK01014806.1.p1  ORF type:complete len:623 (-),score=119.08 GILK01014806.1:260-2128(-)